MKNKFDIEDFTTKYKGTANFCSTDYFKTFYNCLDNETLFSHIEFNNDVLQIPPILTFVKYRQSIDDALFKLPMSKTDKRCLGACFGYLFKYILAPKYSCKYYPVSVWVGEKQTDIKNASYFIKE